MPNATMLNIFEASYDRNIHLTHLEDSVLEYGIQGLKTSLTFLYSITNMLRGHSETRVNIGTKFDGSPSLIAGINPENGRFFVATKSIFNKTPKLNYTEADIRNNHEAEGLQTTLRLALKYLPEIIKGGIYQGDVLFTPEKLKVEKIFDGDCITFQPNTIVYAVEKDSLLGKAIKDAKLGVVWHTSYSGNTIDSLKASLSVNHSSFRNSRNVWFRTAEIPVVAGTATFTKSESDIVYSNLRNIESLTGSVSSRFLNEINNNGTYKELLKSWINKAIKDNTGIYEVARFTKDFLSYVANVYDQKISALKNKVNKLKEKDLVLRYFRNNFSLLQVVFALIQKLSDVKITILRKLETIKHNIHSLYKTDSGFKVAAPEGFVASDKKGNALKLVDRLVFSRNNFQNWTK